MSSDYSQSPERLLIYSEVPTQCMPNYTVQGQDEGPKKQPTLRQQERFSNTSAGIHHYLLPK